MEQPLVHDREKCVQDRAVRLEDLVDERELRLGELPGGDARDAILLDEAGSLLLFGDARIAR